MSNKPALYQYLQFDFYSATPKYLQLAQAVLKAIAEGHLHKDDILPSINELSFEFDMSRDTAEKGYKYLKSTGVLGSVPGKGYYVACTAVNQPLRIFLLFNKLSAHKKIIYDALVKTLGENALIDLYVYHNDFSLFKRLIQNRKGDYTHFVIIPCLSEGDQHTLEVLRELPPDKLVLLGKHLAGLNGEYASIYEQFDQDLEEALEYLLPQLSKYQTLKIIFPDDSYHPRSIIKGFNSFCRQFTFRNKVVQDLENEPIEKGDVFINLMENELVILIEKIVATSLRLGTDVGVISYNETPLKKIILNGITTISTDFAAMGEMAARMILERQRKKVRNRFYVTLRPSL